MIYLWLIFDWRWNDQLDPFPSYLFMSGYQRVNFELIQMSSSFHSEEMMERKAYGDEPTLLDKIEMGLILAPFGGAARKGLRYVR